MIKLPSHSEIIDYFFLNFDLAYVYNELDKDRIIQLVPKELDFEKKFKSIPKITPSYLSWKNWKVPVFIKSKTEKKLDNQLSFDVFVNTFFLLSGWQEWISEDYDEHERFKYANSLQNKFNFVEVPVVTIYFDILFHEIRKQGIPIEERKFSSSLIFTHDIDQLRSGWLEDIQFEIKNFSIKSLFEIPKALIIKLFGLKDSYYIAFEKMIEIEKKKDIEAISFFMTKKSKNDADHDLNKKKYLKLFEAYKKVNKVGLHPGYFTHNSREEFSKQLYKLKELSEGEINHVRQHFLKYDVKVTPLIHEQLEITHDYSLGYAEMYGFRNAIATPFYLYNYKEGRSYRVLQIPLFFMEGTLTKYIGVKKHRNIKKVISLSRRIVNDFNVNFSVLFHNTAFSEKRYKGFTKMYEELNMINETKKN